MTTLKSDLKKSQDLEEKLNCNISQLGGELITLKSEFQNIVNNLTLVNTTLTAKLGKFDLPPTTQNHSFPPNNIKDDTLSMEEGSHSVVKRE